MATAFAVILSLALSADSSGSRTKLTPESIAVAVAVQRSTPVTLAYRDAGYWQMCLAKAIRRDKTRIWFKNGSVCALPSDGRKMSLDSATRLVVCVPLGDKGWCAKVAAEKTDQVTGSPLPTLVSGDFIGNNESLIPLAELIPITPEN